MKYQATVLWKVEVRVIDIEAANQRQAAKIAENHISEKANSLFRTKYAADQFRMNNKTHNPSLLFIEPEEDQLYTFVLVDEESDDEYENSRWYAVSGTQIFALIGDWYGTLTKLLKTFFKACDRETRDFDQNRGSAT